MFFYDFFVIINFSHYFAIVIEAEALLVCFLLLFCFSFFYSTFNTFSNITFFFCRCVVEMLNFLFATTTILPIQLISRQTLRLLLRRRRRRCCLLLILLGHQLLVTLKSRAPTTNRRAQRDFQFCLLSLLL